jgi:uncharacterized protein YndB with AHSA1/START domain
MTTMQQLSVIHSTFVLERSYPSAPERVFAAFADPAKKRRWFLEGGKNEVLEFEMDFRAGGNERARILYKEGPIQGMTISNVILYQDIVPNRRVVSTYNMTLADKRISVSLLTVELAPTETGTDLILTHQGAYFEGADGPQMREQGWSHLLERLAKELAH